MSTRLPLQGLLQFGEEAVVGGDVPGEQDGRVGGQRFRRHAGQEHVKNLAIGRGPQVAALGVDRVRREMDVVRIGEKLVVEEVAEFHVPRRGFQNTPRPLHVPVVPGEVVEDDGDGRVRHAAVVVPHEPEHLRRPAPVLRERPGGLGFLEEDGDAVLRGDQGGPGEPRMEPQALVEAERVPGVEPAHAGTPPHTSHTP